MLREAHLLRSQHGYAFLKIVCCSPLKSGTDPRTGLALFGHRPKDRSRVAQGTDLRTGLRMFRSTELRCTSLCLICLATSFLALELPVPIASQLTRYQFALETQTCRCLAWQMYNLQKEQQEYQEVIVVAQLWFGMRIPRPRLPSCRRREVQ